MVSVLLGRYPWNVHTRPSGAFPVELAYRLIRMFSFVGDTVLDPFAGTCSTIVAAMKAGRNSIANELDPEYFRLGMARVKREAYNVAGLFGNSPQLEVI